MRSVWIVLLAVALAGCSDDGSQYVESRGLSTAPADEWKPTPPPAQPGDDERRAFQMREYPSAPIGVNGTQIKAYVADRDKARIDGLAFVPVEKMKDAGMLFLMPNDEPRLELRELEFDVDVALIDLSKRILSLSTVDAPGGVVGEGSAAKYILVLPRGQSKKLGVAAGQAITMYGGAMAPAGVR